MTKHHKPLKPKQIAEIRDEDIDFSDIPELDGDFWRNAKRVEPGRTDRPPAEHVDLERARPERETARAEKAAPAGQREEAAGCHPPDPAICGTRRTPP